MFEQIHAFFISNTFISNAKLKLAKKVKQILSNTLKLNFWYLEVIGILHPRYHPKIKGHTMRLIIMKMKIKINNRSHR